MRSRQARMLQSSQMRPGERANFFLASPVESRLGRSPIMATAPKQRRSSVIEYLGGDGKPMAKTEIHLHFDDRPVHTRGIRGKSGRKIL
jgi:hypothetical protein